MAEATNWLKGTKPAETPGRHDPKIHGDIPGFPVGSTFATREELCAAAVHAPLRAGIHGTLEDGGYSVVLSYGYEDDEDEGETFVYTGHGGRAAKVSKVDAMMGKESWESFQAKDQEWVAGNAALKVSSVTKKPVRVVRGYSRDKKGYHKYAPAEGYRYDGLYVIERVWRDMGKTGFKTCRFAFRRLPNQPPLPVVGARTAVVKPTAQPSKTSKTYKSPVLTSSTASSNITKLGPGPFTPKALVKPEKTRAPPAEPPYQPSAEDIAKLKASRAKRPHEEIAGADRLGIKRSKIPQSPF